MKKNYIDFFYLCLFFKKIQKEREIFDRKRFLLLLKKYTAFRKIERKEIE